MYCNNCGSHSNDHARFCFYCGNPLTPPSHISTVQTISTPTAPPSPSSFSAPSVPFPPPSSTPDVKPESFFESSFRIQWRNLVCSTFSLVFLIWYSVTQIFKILDFNASLEGIYKILDLLGSLSVLESDFINGANFLLGLIQVLAAAPGAIIAIGMWMMYTDALDRSDRELDIKGLLVIRALYVIQLLLILFVTATTFLLLANALVNTGDGMFPIASDLISTAMLILTIAVALIFLYYQLIMQTINSIIESAESDCPNVKSLTAMTVILFFSGGISVINALSNGITLLSIFNAAIPFLFGRMLVKHKHLMVALLEEKLVTAKTPAQPGATACSSNYIPTWKHVEMARERMNAQNTDK